MTRKRVPCPFCTSVMARASMRPHIRAHHDVNDQIFKCPIAGCGEEHHQFAADMFRKHLAGYGIFEDTRNFSISVSPYTAFRPCSVPLCKYTCKSVAQLLAHTRRAHPAMVAQVSTDRPYGAWCAPSTGCLALPAATPSSACSDGHRPVTTFYCASICRYLARVDCASVCRHLARVDCASQGDAKGYQGLQGCRTLGSASVANHDVKDRLFKCPIAGCG